MTSVSNSGEIIRVVTVGVQGPSGPQGPQGEQGEDGLPGTADLNLIGDVTGSGNPDITTVISADAVTYAKMQNVVADNVLLGNNSGADSVVDELTATEVRTLLNVEDGAEANNVSDANASALTGGTDTTLHYHAADRARAAHTGTQAASTISDFDTEVSNNADVAANTAFLTTPSTVITAGSNIDWSGNTLNVTGVMTNPMTTAGDLIIGGTSGTPDRLAIGADGKVLGVSGGALAFIDGGSGSGDMLASVYDPSSIEADMFDTDNHVDGTINKVYTATEQTKLSGIEAAAEVNNITDVNAGLLTGAADTTLHYHAADRSRSAHTGTQLAATISDFASQVASTAVAKTVFDANTIVKADSDDTPIALSIAASTLVGRAATGSIAALGKADALTILNVEDGAEANNISDANASLLTGGSETTLHNHAAGGITSGTFDSARISEASVTQHQASIAIAETQVSFTDITTGNASTTKHGYLPKLSNVATEFLNGQGSFSTPAGGGDMLASVYDPTSVADDAFDQDNMADGTTNKNYTATEQTKLSGIETGAQVNVQSNWNAVSGDALILNKPVDLTVLSSHNVTELADVTSAGSGIIISGTERTKLGNLDTAKQVTNGDSHNHSGGDGAQIAHTALSAIGTNTHAQIDTHIADSTLHYTQASIAIAETQVSFTDITTGNASTTKHGYLPKLSNVATEFLNGQGSFTTIAGGGDMEASVYDPTNIADDAFDQDNMVDGTTNKNYTATEQTKLGNLDTAKQVTNGDSHNHSGGDGAQIAHTALSSIGTNTHAQIDTHIADSTLHYTQASIAIAETQVSFTDITTGNASTTKHGYLPKLAGGTTTFLRADGTYATPTATASPPSTTAVTASKTLAIGDANTSQRCNSASTITITVPPNSSVAFTTDTEIYIFGAGAGTVTIAEGSGVTINSKDDNLDLDGQYAGAALKKVATDTWDLVGALA